MSRASSKLNRTTAIKTNGRLTDMLPFNRGSFIFIREAAIAIAVSAITSPGCQVLVRVRA